MSRSILFVAGEGLPFIKTGGLADVIGSLPKALAERGHDVRVVIPLYKKVIDKHFSELKRLGTIQIHSGWIDQPATFYTASVDGVIYYFVEHKGYFERDTLYGYEDDGERFSFFQRAVLDMIYFIDWWPNIIHSNDWQCGMIPLLCHACYAGDSRYQSIKHVYTIHNLAFQGNFGVDMLPSCLGLDYYYFDNGSIKFDTGISFMKAGIVYADKVTTVSPTYSNEILTETYGEKMDSILRYRRDDLWGIVNGIDIDSWNPKTDKHLAKNFDLRTNASGKKANKLALQEELGLKVTNDTCLIGLVSRLTRQKGVYLITDRLSEILGMDVQFVVLGTGEDNAENAFKWMETQNKGKAVYYCGYNEDLAHRIYAGADLFLMPSLYEPCGIGQLIAMHYGTLPIVRETGGLKDTVHPFNEYTGEGNGFSFWAANADDMVYTISYAVHQYYDNKPGWKGLIKSAMTTDVSWAKSAGIYEELYYQLCDWSD
ncbi:MAG: glycogen synthase GlgA [Erysipelotrichia bacterium]|nr:glycogen synthase GlgA [Erysipelotrichia bacterium]